MLLKQSWAVWDPTQLYYELIKPQVCYCLDRQTEGERKRRSEIEYRRKVSRNKTETKGENRERQTRRERIRWKGNKEERLARTEVKRSIWGEKAEDQSRKTGGRENLTYLLGIIHIIIFISGNIFNFLQHQKTFSTELRIKDCRKEADQMPQ